MGSNASLSGRIERVAGGCTPGKINLPTVCRYGWSFSACLSPTFAHCLSWSAFFFGAKIGPTRARKFNSLSRHIPRSSSRLMPIWRKVVRRLLRNAGAGFRRLTCIFIHNTVYNYVRFHSRNNIVSVYLNLVILKTKPSTKAQCRRQTTKKLSREARHKTRFEQSSFS